VLSVDVVTGRLQFDQSNGERTGFDAGGDDTRRQAPLPIQRDRISVDLG